METPQVRLIASRDGWWAIHGARYAHLPVAAVGDVTDISPAEASVPHDSTRSRALTGPAATALADGGFFSEPNPRRYAVTVLTATACNLGCIYCFQNTAVPTDGGHAPPRISRAVLDEDTTGCIATFVRDRQQAEGRPEASLLIFGGEPLLNPDGCLGLLRAFAPLNLVDAEMVTNGVLLTRDRAETLHRAGLRRLQITFDGSAESHDTIRVTRNGRATYGTILRNVAGASAACPDLTWNFRVNVSHHNLAGLESLVADLATHVADPSRATFHLALIDDVGIGYTNEVGYDAELAARFAALNGRAIAAGFRVPVSSGLDQCPYCSVVGGHVGAVINADGVLYSCWENAGRPEWSVGDVRTGYTHEMVVKERWVACDFDTASHGDSEVTREFFDFIDAAALDDQRATDSLTLVSASTAQP